MPLKGDAGKVPPAAITGCGSNKLTGKAIDKIIYAKNKYQANLLVNRPLLIASLYFFPGCTENLSYGISSTLSIDVNQDNTQFVIRGCEKGKRAQFDSWFNIYGRLFDDNSNITNLNIIG